MRARGELVCFAAKRDELLRNPVRATLRRVEAEKEQRRVRAVGEALGVLERYVRGFYANHPPSEEAREEAYEVICRYRETTRIEYRLASALEESSRDVDTGEFRLARNVVEASVRHDQSPLSHICRFTFLSQLVAAERQPRELSLVGGRRPAPTVRVVAGAVSDAEPHLDDREVLAAALCATRLAGLKPENRRLESVAERHPENPLLYLRLRLDYTSL